MIKKKNRVIEKHVDSDGQLFKQFVTMSAAHIDPVLASMLYATDLIQYDKVRQVVEINTLKKFILFQDLFMDQKKIYQKYLDQVFGYQTTLIVQFNKEEVVVEKVKIVQDVAKVATQTVSDTVQSAAQKSVSRPAFGQDRPKTAVPGQFTPRKVQRYQPSEVYNKNERTVDVADTKKWKITHMLLENFGGSVREIIRENIEDTTDEFDA